VRFLQCSVVVMWRSDGSVVIIWYSCGVHNFIWYSLVVYDDSPVMFYDGLNRLMIRAHSFPREKFGKFRGEFGKFRGSPRQGR